MGDTRARQDLADHQDEAYFDPVQNEPRSFDTKLLQEPLALLNRRTPLVLAREATVREASREMQNGRQGAVAITEDGGAQSRVIGIFTERDVLLRIVDGGRNPATLALAEVMTQEPECLLETRPVAEALQLMSVGGFRHIPVVDDAGRPVSMLSVKDVVQFIVEAFPDEILRTGAPKSTREREGG